MPPLTALSPTLSRRQPALSRQLASFGSQPALISGDERVSYTQLAARVGESAAGYGSGRRLVMIAGSHEIACYVAYLAALSAGHVVLLVPPEDEHHLRAWVETYDPDVVVRSDTGWLPRERRTGTAHELHPDLALLLTTSGSTGSPKLVRLSYDNLDANAESIATFLAIGSDDRAVTTLPLAYCFGLSILHSHLLRGASLVLTGLSVVDECFWALCREQQVTALSGVPYTFQLLDRVGFLDRDLPSLRQLTQAGGKMPAEQVRRYAEGGRERGWELVVMYGQTEATARMAYLPPELALSRPEAIGRPVPGGALRLGPVDAAGVGELLYSGPNVMLGYAERSSDLSLGRTVRELATGDLARQGADGLFEVVGRQSRFAKVFGLRLDLQVLEQALAVQGLTAWATGTGDSLVVLVERPADERDVRRAAARAAGLPRRAVRVVRVDVLPRTARGKVDGPAATALAKNPSAGDPPEPRTTAGAGAPPESIAALYAEVLGRTDVDDESTFSGLGGDSLSYVEVSMRLEDVLGELPPAWHAMPVRLLEQARTRQGGKPSSVRLDTTVLLRAVGILLIVGTHAHLFGLKGGAHALIAVAGYNFARFRLTRTTRRDRLLGMWRGVRRIAVPSAVIIGATALTTAQIGRTEAALLNSVLGPDLLGPGWRYWFVEALVHVLVLLAVLLAVPAVDRAERRWPFWFPVALVGAGVLSRSVVLAIGSGPDRTQSAAAVLCLFALGWSAARTRTATDRRWLTAVALVLVAWFFVNRVQGLVVLVALVLLVWAPSVALPRLLVPLRPALGVLAAASLYVYLTHWPVLGLFQGQPLLSAIGCLTVGLAADRVAGLVRRRWCSARQAGRHALAARRSRCRPALRSAGVRELPATAGRRGELVGSGAPGSAG